MLYLVATPIGNLEDITLRALRILREVDLIAAEDTRTTGKLLHHFEITTPMVSYHEYSEENRIDFLMEKLQTEKIALVTDAGMPSVSDPGFRLVQSAVALGHPIVPIPGANAALTALIASGLPTDRFLFLGFLPRQTTARQTALRDVQKLPYTLIFYEAPHRLLESLQDLLDLLGDRPICIGRELTKFYEEFWRGSISDALVDFGGRDAIRGEVTLVLGGATEEVKIWTEAEIRIALVQKIDQGFSPKDAIQWVCELSSWRKKQVYAVANQLFGK